MMNVFSLSSASVSDSGPTLRVTPQKMRCRRRARVVLPLDEGPEIPTTRALGVGWIGDMEGECEEEKIEFGHRRSVGSVGRFILSYRDDDALGEIYREEMGSSVRGVWVEDKGGI